MTALSAVTSQAQTAPYGCTDVPMRPYATAVVALWKSRARRRMTSAGTPVRALT